MKAAIFLLFSLTMDKYIDKNPKNPDSDRNSIWNWQGDKKSNPVNPGSENRLCTKYYTPGIKKVRILCKNELYLLAFLLILI
jgi:hypothetical protein